MDFVDIHGGKFKMGAEESDEHALYLETPQVEVEVSPFQIAAHAVTNVEWYQFIKDSGYKGLGKNYLLHWQKKVAKEHDPVTWIAREDAEAFCKFYHYSLPTEAQWECAAQVLGAEEMLGLWVWCRDLWDEWLLHVLSEHADVKDPCIEEPSLERMETYELEHQRFFKFLSRYGVLRGCGKDWLRFGMNKRYPLKPAIYRRAQVPKIARHHYIGLRPVYVKSNTVQGIMSSWEDVLFEG